MSADKYGAIMELYKSDKTKTIINIIILLTTLAFLLFVVHEASQIRFMQNDDWVYYKNVENFIKGDFNLNLYTGAIFYIQGFMGLLFITIFPLNKLPLLTIFISMISIVLLFGIYRTLNSKLDSPVLYIASVFIAFPIFIYSTLGFMTENYFNLFTILFIFSICLFEKKHRVTFIIISMLFLLAAFFIRQIGFAFIIGTSVYFFLTNRKVLAMQYFLLAVVAFLSYIVIESFRLDTQNVNELHLLNPNMLVFRLFVTILFILTFTAPLLLSTINFKNIFKRDLLIISIISLLLALFSVKSGLFFFGNIFTVYGYLPSNIMGTKSYVPIIYLLLYLLNSLAIFVGIILIKTKSNYLLRFVNDKQNRINLFIKINSFIYISIILFTGAYFDRYLLPLFTLLIIFFMNNVSRMKYFKPYVICIWLLLMTFVNYHFVSSFLVSHNILLTETNRLVIEGVKPGEIKSEVSWNLYNRDSVGNIVYLFSYSSRESGYEPLTELPIKYPFNLNPINSIYLHKCIESCNIRDFPNWQYGF